MFRKFRKFKSKKAQNTAEYALLISLVVAGIIAMQTYAQRALQGQIFDAVNMSVSTIKSATSSSSSVSGWTGTTQYEPYYLKREYDVTSKGDTTKKFGTDETFTKVGSQNRERAEKGYEVFTYNQDQF